MLDITSLLGQEVLVSQIIQMANFKYGLILLVTSFILLGGAFTVYQVYKGFNMDVEAKVFTHIFFFIMMSVPLYFWIDSIIMIVKVNCYREYFVLSELAKILGSQ